MKRYMTGLILPLFAVFLAGCAGLISGKAEIDWANWQQDIILSLRFTRVCGAFVIGAALAVAGMTLQAVLRNPLAEPFTLGISGGASVGAALTFILHIHTWGIYTIPVFALTGALTVLVLVLFFSRRLTTEDLLLSGVIAGTVSSSALETFAYGLYHFLIIIESDSHCFTSSPFLLYRAVRICQEIPRCITVSCIGGSYITGSRSRV